jgi:hypothetical protein
LRDALCVAIDTRVFPHDVLNGFDGGREIGHTAGYWDWVRWAAVVLLSNWLMYVLGSLLEMLPLSRAEMRAKFMEVLFGSFVVQSAKYIHYR